MIRRSHPVLLGLSLLLLATSMASAAFDDAQLEEGYQFRSIGPYRGGRSCAVAGVPGDALTYYFGGTGGGVFKSEDGGRSWTNVSDGYFGGSIGAVAVSAWDPNVIYVGGGEKTVRGNVSHGYGVWRSLDAGRTWTSVGLEGTRHVGRIRIHPRDPDTVYVAAMGHLFGPNEQRGLYRSRDAGETWERVLYVSDEVGCVDVAMDPTNPRVLYASFWRVLRTPYSLESGGEGSSLWKSTNGGDTWTEITRNEGLPGGVIGINCMTVSPVDPDRVWAIIEAEDGGVFRSEDGGDTWQRVNENRNLRQRAWYYTRIYADPQDVDTVYVLNVSFWRSKDGGKEFESIDTPHGDHHDLWIAPEDPSRMVIGDDGGAQVTFDAGETWTTYHNQATAQFYRVTTDGHFPYRIYGAQQDNSTVRILHRSDGRVISAFDWEPTAGGESGWLAPDPQHDWEVVYGGSYGGYLQRYDHRTGETRIVNVWPDNPMGHGAKGMKERFQWNFPILFSRHEPGLLYAAGNRLFVTRDEGQSWQAISGDLTRDDPSRLGPSGGPITKDNTGVEYYCTIFTVAEDAFEAGVIWTGSDDGLVHVTRDGGETWTDVTPEGMPEWIQVNSIEADPHRAGGAYLAGTMYKGDDFRPYLYRTRDYGRTWTKIVEGIDPQHFTRVIRTDPVRQGLLFAGTESGLYVSLDDGAQWSVLQLNLPVVPITDLAVKDDDLVVATQGRSFWVLDDLTVLHQWTEAAAAADHWLFAPRTTWRTTSVGRWPIDDHNGENHPDGALVHYRFTALPDSDAVALRILEENGDIIRTFTPKADRDGDRMSLEEGTNRLVWDLRYPDAHTFDGMVLWAGLTRGPRAVPGRYRVRLVVEDDSTEVDFELRKDPRSEATQADLQDQFDFLLSVRDRLSEMHRAIERIRAVREQMNAVLARAEDTAAHETLQEAADPVLETLKTVEEALYQTRNRSPQDPLNYPIRLNNKLAALAWTVSAGDARPTDQALDVRAELSAAIDAQLARLRTLMEEDVPRFNALVAQSEVPAIKVPAGPPGAE